MKHSLILSALASAVALSAQADTFVWSGGIGSTWDTPSAWMVDGQTADRIPNADDDVVIESGEVIYDAAGGDWTRAEGSTFTLKGGSFTQVNGIAYMQIRGAIVIEGGDFSMGTAGQLVLQSTGSITMSSGSFTPTVIDNHGGTITCTGGQYGISGNYMVHAGSDVTLGADCTMSILGELQFNSENPTLGVGTYVANLVAQQGGSGTLSLDGSRLVSGGGHVCGTYGNAPVLNFVSAGGNVSSYTYTGVESDSEIYSKLFANGRFLLDGETVTEQQFSDSFVISRNEGKITLTLVVEAADWRIVSAGVSNLSSSTATLKATVKNCASADGAVYYAVGTSENAVKAAATDVTRLVSAETAAAADQAVTVALTDLAEDEKHYFLFAIVADGEVVAVTDVGSFIPSDFDNIYVDGDWTKGTPAAGQRLLFKDAVVLNQADYNGKSFASFTVDVADGQSVDVAPYTGITLTGKLTIRGGSVTVDVSSYLNYTGLVLAGGTYTRAGNISFSDPAITAAYALQGGVFNNNGEVQVGDFQIENTVLSATVYTPSDTAVRGKATRFVSTIMPDSGAVEPGRWEQVPYGTYLSPRIDLIPVAMADRIVPTSCGYQFRYDGSDESAWTAKSSDDIYDYLFRSGRISVNGAFVSAEDFAKDFVVLTDETKATQLVTRFETLGSTADGKWTLENGAVVRLSGNVSLKGMTMKGASSVVDLNGKSLKLSKKVFTVNGKAAEAGVYTAADGTLAALTDQIVDSVGTGKLIITNGNLGFAVMVR